MLLFLVQSWLAISTIVEIDCENSPFFERSAGAFSGGVAWSPDGRQLATGPGTGGIQIWNLTSSEYVLLDQSYWYFSLAWHRRGLAAATYKSLDVWNINGTIFFHTNDNADSFIEY